MLLTPEQKAHLMVIEEDQEDIHQDQEEFHQDQEDIRQDQEEFRQDHNNFNNYLLNNSANNTNNAESYVLSVGN